MNIDIFKFIKERAKRLGIKLIYSVLLMYYAYKSDRTPAWARRIILGSLAYLVSPIDSIPDLTPFLGFTDDLGIITFGLVSIASYIDQDVKDAAKNKLQGFFKNIDKQELQMVDEKL